MLWIAHQSTATKPVTSAGKASRPLKHTSMEPGSSAPIAGIALLLLHKFSN